MKGYCTYFNSSLLDVRVCRYIRYEYDFHLGHVRHLEPNLVYYELRQLRKGMVLTYIRTVRHSTDAVLDSTGIAKTRLYIQVRRTPGLQRPAELTSKRCMQCEQCSTVQCLEPCFNSSVSLPHTSPSGCQLDIKQNCCACSHLIVEGRKSNKVTALQLILLSRLQANAVEKLSREYE
jgi:hypothetical protein